MQIEQNNLRENQIGAHAAANVTVDESSEGQRIDNFLTKILKACQKVMYIAFCVVAKCA